MSSSRVSKIALATLAIATCASLAPGADSAAQWWQNAVVYEVYPRSFGDSNGDGIGDLNGITEHLDYLRELGIDAIWITPCFPSPQVDFGYDISSYHAIDPQYGTLVDFDRLVAEAKKRNIRVLLDFVLNHTSDQHVWFLESKSSRTNPKADWYVWRDGKDHQAPNNWQSLFGHSAWQFLPERGQFYYHAFALQQPDLNWRNREVRDAMYDEMRFWMRRGVSGFRLDAVAALFEDPQFRDEAVKPGKNPSGEPIVTHEYTSNLAECHDVFRELHKVTDEYPGGVLIGETFANNAAELAKLYGAHDDEIHLPMDTQFAFARFSAESFREKLREAETQLGDRAPLFLFENHDSPRSINRFGDGKHNPEIAKLLATLLLTPRCAALLYYGEEIGMENNDPTRKEDVRDPIGRAAWPKFKGRDGERTPMQWDASVNAGFSAAKTTWLPVAPNYPRRNVAAETRDPDSLLNYYKVLMRLRRTNGALRDGAFQLVNESDKNVLAFVRKAAGGKTVLVALNFTAHAQTAQFDLGSATHSTTLLSSFSKAGESSNLKALALAPFGSYVGEIQ